MMSAYAKGYSDCKIAMEAELSYLRRKELEGQQHAAEERVVTKIFSYFLEASIIFAMFLLITGGYSWYSITLV